MDCPLADASDEPWQKTVTAQVTSAMFEDEISLDERGTPLTSRWNRPKTQNVPDQLQGSPD